MSKEDRFALREWFAYFSDYRDLSSGILKSVPLAAMSNSSAEIIVVDKSSYLAMQELAEYWKKKCEQTENALAEADELLKRSGFEGESK